MLVWESSIGEEWWGDEFIGWHFDMCFSWGNNIFGRN